MIKTVGILGCGWLGLPLGKRLREQGYNVHGSTTSEDKVPVLASVGIQPFLIDIKHLNERVQYFLEVEVLVIAIIKQEVTYFEELIKYIEQSQIKKVLFISSTSVYENNNLTVTEETPAKACLLADIEELFLVNSHFKTTILRFGGLFGYDRKPVNFIKPGRLMTNPEGCINLIHQDDCIGIIENIIVKEAWGEIFHASADSHPKRRDFYTQEAMKMGKESPVFEETSESVFKIIDSSKLKSALEYNFKHSDLMNYQE